MTRRASADWYLDDPPAWEEPLAELPPLAGPPPHAAVSRAMPAMTARTARALARRGRARGGEWPVACVMGYFMPSRS